MNLDSNLINAIISIESNKMYFIIFFLFFLRTNAISLLNDSRLYVKQLNSILNENN